MFSGLECNTECEYFYNTDADEFPCNNCSRYSQNIDHYSPIKKTEGIQWPHTPSESSTE